MDDLPGPVTWLHNDVPKPILSPQGQSLFFGFHDLCPWSPVGPELLVLRLPQAAQSMADTTQTAEICFWDPERGTIDPVGETDCWNFQQAARQQWFPGSGSFTYNRRSAAGRCEAVLHHPLSSAERTIAGGLYCIAPDATWGLSPDFDVLAHRWPAYGYRNLLDQDIGSSSADHGIWKVDLSGGERQLLVSLDRVLGLWEEAGLSANDAKGHFLTHPSISPDGDHIVFLHRFFAADEGSFTRMLCCEADGSNLRVLADEKVSHFDWLDADNLIVWARFSGGGLAQMRASGKLNSPLIRPILNMVRKFTGRWKKRLLAEAYYILPIDNPQEREKIGWPELDCDGHPMAARNHDWVVTDMYPDRSGELPLILWNSETGQRVDVARIRNGVQTTDSDAKCDLHPRWNRDETKIAVDCCENGPRRIAIFDVSKIVGGPR